MKHLCLGISFILFLNSCRVQKRPLAIKEAPNQSQHHFGYLFVDLNSGDTLGKQDSDKYFIPASTTKLFTWYTSLAILKDSVPALSYKETIDSVVFWGTGDPSFLRKGFHQQGTLDFFKSKTSKTLVFSDSNFDENPHGKGWMWDDNLESYQTEVSAFPMYGNLVSFDGKAINPPYFKGFTSEAETQVRTRRAKEENLFEIGETNHTTIPFKTSGPLTALLLQDTINIPISHQKISKPKETITFYSASRDSLLIPMLRYSDNMIAEQLMLLSGHQLFDTLSIQKSINYMLDHELSRLPQKPRWVDGSGLSRYNLFSPEDLVFLLAKVRREIGEAKTLTFLPSNGELGTLSQFNEHEETFIYAKSGSMSGVYNLAGYLKTDSGRTLAFAVMNNNFTRSVNSVRQEMAQFLLEVKAKH